MKKLLIGLAVLSIGAAAQADVKFSGDTLLGYTNVSNAFGVKDANSEGWALFNNIMIDGNKGEQLSYHLQLRHIANFGTNFGPRPSANDSAAATALTAPRSQQNDLVYVQEAIAYAKVNENGTFAFGRAGLELNQGQLVSKRSFDNTQIAFDGVRYVHDADWGRLGLTYSIAGKGEGTFAGAVASNHIKFRGLSYTLKNTPEALSNVEFHYVNAAADGALAAANGNNANNSRTWIGLNLAGEMGAFDYQLNVENFKGDTTNGAAAEAKATMIDLNAGFRMPNVMDSRIYLIYHNDGTTDDGFYDGLYYDNHKYSGLMDIVKWGNLSEIALGYTFKPTASGTMGIAAHQFQRVKDDKLGILNGVTSAGAAIDGTFTGTDKDIGTEIDVWYMHTYSSGLFVNAELGTFSPGNYMKNNQINSTDAKDSITRLYVETGFSF